MVTPGISFIPLCAWCVAFKGVEDVTFAVTMIDGTYACRQHATAEATRKWRNDAERP